MGDPLGFRDGAAVLGTAVGATLGLKLGAVVGAALGLKEGTLVDGVAVGVALGVALGLCVGAILGFTVGTEVDGVAVGTIVGTALGLNEGPGEEALGLAVGTSGQVLILATKIPPCFNFKVLVPHREGALTLP